MFFDQAQPENYRVAVPTGSFSGEAWVEKRPGDEFEEIPNRLYDEKPDSTAGFFKKAGSSSSWASPCR